MIRNLRIFHGPNPDVHRPLFLIRDEKRTRSLDFATYFGGEMSCDHVKVQGFAVVSHGLMQQTQRVVGISKVGGSLGGVGAGDQAIGQGERVQV